MLKMVAFQIGDYFNGATWSVVFVQRALCGFYMPWLLGWRALRGGSLRFVYLLSPFPNCPDGAREVALDEMRYAMMSHDCAPEMEVWARSSGAPSTYLFNKENNICSEHDEHVGWLVADATVRALFRCDLGGRLAEYSMTVFRDPETISGPSWCEYIIKPNADDLGLGQNFAFVQYSAKYTRNKYADGEVAYEPAN